MSHQNISVIGGGAAGLMAVSQLLSLDNNYVIHLFEKNTSLGAKVIISGGGRCNVTTSFYRWKDLKDKYIRGSERIRYAIGKFGPRKIYKWFEDNGVPLKKEADMRVFPRSNNGKDIVGVFENMFKKAEKNGKLVVHYSTSVSFLDKKDSRFTVITKDDVFRCSSVIIATGGKAYAHTGSTGDAYAWASSMGHDISSLGPSLNSLLSQKSRLNNLSGLSFPQASLYIENKEYSGPLLFTHFGLSGPLAFIVSAHSSFLSIDKNNVLSLRFKINKKEDFAFWNARLLRETSVNSRKQLHTILKSYLPNRFVDEFFTCYMTSSRDFPVGSLKKAERITLAKLLSGGITINIVGRRPGDEFVTAGGVCTEQVDNKTMMSTIVPGMFFAGEVLNVDGVTGGYNLTSSRATGCLAGQSVLSYLSSIKKDAIEE